MPFMMGVHYCSIVFEDAHCGKFVYEMSGEAKLPSPFREQKFVVSSLTVHRGILTLAIEMWGGIRPFTFLAYLKRAATSSCFSLVSEGFHLVVKVEAEWL